MSQIRRRGNSLQVNVFAGYDPLTGRRLYLSESTTDLDKAYRIRDRLRGQVAEQRSARTRASFSYAMREWLKTHEIEVTTRESYEMYLRRYIGPAFGDVPISKITTRTLEEFYAHLRRCSKLCDGRPRVDHLDQQIKGEHVCRLVTHRRPPGRPPAAGYPPHDCSERGCRITECRPHVCTPLSTSTTLKVHWVISGVFAAAIRWDWISGNPADVAKKPRQPVPQPNPPTLVEASKIVQAAWAQDPAWGTLVWLVHVTGMRRAEVLALRWQHVNLEDGVLKVHRNHVRISGKSYDKDPKSHQERSLALDEVTVGVLAEHRARYDKMTRALGAEPHEDAYLFSYSPTFDRPYSPDGVTHRYIDMCAGIGIDTNLKALRHYSATELLQAGVDLRTVAGRLGHGGGGATTLRVYTAWTSEADRRAAKILGSRIQRPGC